MSLTERPLAGFECKMYIADIEPSEYDPDTLPSAEVLSEIKNARDVSISGSAEELDASARYSDEKKYYPGMFDNGIEFDYEYIRGGEGVDPVFDVIEAARLAREPLCVITATGDIEVAGNIWEQNWYYVFKGDTDEGMGNTRTKKYSLKPGVVFNSGDMLGKGMGEVEE